MFVRPISENMPIGEGPFSQIKEWALQPENFDQPLILTKSGKPAASCWDTPWRTSSQETRTIFEASVGQFWDHQVKQIHSDLFPTEQQKGFQASLSAKLGSTPSEQAAQEGKARVMSVLRIRKAPEQEEDIISSQASLNPTHVDEQIPLQKVAPKNREEIDANFVQEVYKSLLQELFRLRQSYSRPQKLGLYTNNLENRDFTVNRAVALIEPASLPEMLIFSGGGVKGAGYGGALRALEFAGMLKNVKHVVGSSVGAITAAAVAVGMSAEEFVTATNQIDYAGFLNQVARNPVIRKAVPTEDWIGGDGSYAAEQINRSINKALRRFFKQRELPWQKLDFLTEQPVIKKLGKELFSTGGLDKVFVTFQELALLVKMDNRFKKLTVTGFDVTDKKEIYFSVEDYPNIPIVAAVRASMSLPIVFDPVKLNKKIFVDGGVGSNTPTELIRPGLREDLENIVRYYSSKSKAEVLKEFLKQREMIEPHERERERELAAKTLVFGLESEGYLYNALFYPDFRSTSYFSKLIDLVKTYFTGNPLFEADQVTDCIELWHGGPNTLMVSHGALRVESFNASKKEIGQAQLQAEIRMLEQLLLRQNQAHHKTFFSLQEALQALTPKQIEQIAKEPWTDPQMAALLKEHLRELGGILGVSCLKPISFFF